MNEESRDVFASAFSYISEIMILSSLHANARSFLFVQHFSILYLRHYFHRQLNQHKRQAEWFSYSSHPLRTHVQQHDASCLIPDAWCDDPHISIKLLLSVKFMKSSLNITSKVGTRNAQYNDKCVCESVNIHIIVTRYWNDPLRQRAWEYLLIWNGGLKSRNWDWLRTKKTMKLIKEVECYNRS